MSKPVALCLILGLTLYGFDDTAAGFKNLSVAEAETVSTYEDARDFLNDLEGMRPGFIAIGQYLPGEMSEENYGIWLEYKARTYNSFGLEAHYFRLKDLDEVEIGRTATGACRLKLTGPERDIGYYWETNVGWQRGLATLHFRSSDCDSLEQAGEAFSFLIEMDGGAPVLTSNLR